MGKEMKMSGLQEKNKKYIIKLLHILLIAHFIVIIV